MIGQGGPSPSHAQRSSWWYGRWRRTGFTIAALLAALVPAVAGAQQRSMRLRVAWGGGESRRWHGSVELTEGVLSELVPLGVEADEPGSMWIDGSRVLINGPSGRTYDGFDCTVDAPPEARLLFRLSSRVGQPLEPPLEVTLEAAGGDSFGADLKDGNNRLLVRRAPGDKLHVELDRDALVFSPAEKWRLALQPRLWGLAPAARVRFRCELRGDGDARPLWTNEYELTADAQGAVTGEILVEVPVPEREGVYHVDIAAAARRLPTISLKNNLAERRVQFVVIDPQAPQSGDAAGAGWSKVVEINPASPTWWERIAKVPLLPGARKGPLGTGEAHPWQHPLGQFIQLGPGGREPNISWQAYPLPIDRPGMPHQLEVDYPSDVPQVMGLSIIEPNAAGDVMPIGLDSGVYLPGEAATESPALMTHRLTFWPRTKTPMLLITNRRDAAQAVYGKIRVLAGPHRLPVANLGGPAGERLLAAYYDRPLFPENFGAAESLDPSTGRSLDDWHTFYQGATRLVQYLEHAGYNGALVSVFADGSSLYPSLELEPTPRYDTGLFFGNGQDPRRKDVLELLLRMFDRSRLKLVPGLDFAAPLPELEALCRAEPAVAAGIEPVGRDGRSWRTRHAPAQGLAPYYNLLDPRVQQVLLQRIREVASRSAAHTSFAGLALQLSAEGYAQLPGLNWGFDDQTIARFERETGVRLNAVGPQRFGQRAALLTGTHRKLWIDWRMTQVTRFYGRVAAELKRVRPDARLYLAAGNALENPELQTGLQPTLPARSSIEDALRSAGIDPDIGRKVPDVVLLRPQRLTPPTSLAARAIDLAINDSPELDRYAFEAPISAALCYHEPQKARVVSFDKQSPYRQTYTWLVSQLQPSGAQNRRRLVHGLAALDAQALFDGGWLLSLGQEESLADLVALYRRLPAARFLSFPSPTQPVTIRTAIHNGATYVYLVNDSPWHIEVDTTWQLPGGCRRESLSPARKLEPLAQRGASTLWRVKLEPYDAVGARFDAAVARLIDARVILPETVVGDLEARIRDLQSLALALRNQPPLDTLLNADFEQPLSETGGIPGWVVTEQAGISAELIAAGGEGNRQALRFASLGPVGSVASLPIAPPETGRLEIAVRLRVEDPARQPPLRIALEARHNGEEYYRHAAVGRGTETAAIGGQWAQFVFQVDDLPLEGLSQLRVRFDLMGAGEVSIDEVQLHPLRFYENENIELLLIIAAAQVKLQERQWSDCLRLIEGYWAQFLAMHVPLTEQPLATRPSAPAKSDPPRRAPDKTTLRQQINRLLPERIRPF